MEDKNVEKKQDKKIKIFGLVSLGIIFVLIITIAVINATTTREEKILKHLEDKYNEYFEIVRVKESGELILIKSTSECLSIPSKEIQIPFYLYEIRAYKDDLIFELMYEDKFFYNEINEDYFRLSRGDKFLNEIAEYIVFEIGDKHATVDFEKYGYQGYGMEGHIIIDVDKNLDDNMNVDYIENKIKKLSSYIKGKMKEQENVIINVVVNFNDGKSVCFYEWNVLPLIRVLLENKYYTYTPYEYLKSIQGN